MNINKNTKIRLRVPKALYESMKAEIAKNENYSFDEKPEEMEEGSLNEYQSIMQLQDFQMLAGILGVAVPVAASIVGVLGVDAAKKLIAKFKGKKATNESDVNEYFSPMELPDMQVLAGILGVAAPVATALVSVLGKDAVKKLYAKLKGKKADAKPTAEPEKENMEEALDLETLMEAVKEINKKKAEAKKKKEIEDKKKKEAEAKKKAAAAKKK